MAKLKALLAVVSILVAWWSVTVPAQASAGKLGMHVLRPEEMEQVIELFSELPSASDDTREPVFVTLPFSYADVERLEIWQAAFDLAAEHNVVPLVRLTTRFDPATNAWGIPDRYHLVKQAVALNRLDWPQEERHVILFNEPNHAPEWGGTFDEQSLAEAIGFTADWLHTEEERYIVLPPAMDLAASNTVNTKEAFTYWKLLIAADPDLLDHFDAWNSHSYPNPGFTASPYLSAQNSLRGYKHELAWLSQYSDKKWPVYITETGWLDRFSQATLTNYYRYAVNNIWNDDQVVAVTPFLLAGSPGPFADFSFVDEQGEPTKHWQALATALTEWQQELLSQR